MLKRRSFWIILSAIVLIVFGGTNLINNRSARPQRPVVQAAGDAPPTLDFLPGDLIQVKSGDLRQSLALTGSLRAVNQAAVKAKVSGEVHAVLVREGEAVRQGQVLARMDVSEYRSRLDQANGAQRAALGQLDIAIKSRDNNQSLFEKGFISKTAFDNAQSQHVIAQANVESSRGAVEVARKMLEDTVIRAPISGLISSRNVQPGEKVSPDYRLFDVVDLRQMELEAAVPVTDIGNIAVGQEVQVSVDGLAQPLNGKVARINPATQPGSRAIMAYIQLDNPLGVLRGGMFGEARVTLAIKAGVLTIPPSAIQSSGGLATVYAVEDGRLAQKALVLGVSGEDASGVAVEVVKGIGVGAQVVRTNLGKLRDGALVRLSRTKE